MKYIIPRGKEFYCEFVIKEPGASLPYDVTGATGNFNLTKIGPNPCLVLTEQLAVKDGINGIMSVTLTAAQTDALVGRKAFPEDGYPLIPTYSANLDITTPLEPIDVVIPKVYIMDEGIACPVVTP